MRQLIYCAIAACLILTTSCQKENIQPTDSPSKGLIDENSKVSVEPYDGDAGDTPNVGINTNPTSSNNDPSILEHLKDNPNFSIFYASLFRTGMAELVDGDGPFTFFVPDNQAFQEFLNSNDWNTINDVPINTLTQVVKFHISETQVNIADLTMGVNVPILFNQKTVYINMDDPKYPFVVLGLTSAYILKSDMIQSNGVIHHINGVLAL